MLIPNGTHIMVLDGSKRVLYRNDGEAIEPDLTLIEDIEKPSSSTAEQGTDRPGRQFESAGTSRGAYESTDYHQQEEDRFTLEAVDQLNRLSADGKHKVILVATPHVLGLMPPLLNAATQNLLLAEINKDYAGRSARDIAHMLVQHNATQL